MNAQEPLDALNPDPAEVVGLVEKLVEGIWPRSDAERKAWFARMGFVSGAGWDDALTPPAVGHFSLSTQLTGEVSSSYTSYDGRFMGISLQLYSSMETGNPSTKQGFDDIRSQLAALYGQSENPWQDPVIPARVWHHNGRRITIRFFNLQHSGVMVSVDDAGLVSAADAEARRRNAPAHWNPSEEGASPFNVPKLGRRA